MTWSNDFIDTPARQCAGKRTYDTHAEAKQRIKRLKGLGQGIVGSYRCPHCARIHLGHPPSGSRARKAS